MASVIAITSGKGGVGKTNVALNLGLALATRDVKVCVFDADTGLANINILLGVQPQYTLEHVLSGDKTLNEILFQVDGGLYVVPAASGVGRCTDLNAAQRNTLVNALRELEQRFDFVLVDTAAGIERSVLDFVSSAQYRIVVITPEPTALTDAFALLKMLARRGGKRNLFALVNRVDGYRASQNVFRRFQGAVSKYLKLDLHYLGYLADDPALTEAVGRQVPVITGAPGSSVSCCFFALADILKRQFLNEKNLPYFSHYWQKLALPQGVKREPPRPVSEPPASVGRAAGRDLQSSDLLTWLQNRNYPEAEMKELIMSLESLYEKRHGKSPKYPDSIMVGWLSDASTSEEKARRAYRALSDAFERRFRKRLDDPEAAVLDLAQDDRFDRQAFFALLKRLNEIYHARFDVAYYGNAEQLLDKINRLLSER